MHKRCMVPPDCCRLHDKDPVRVTGQLPTKRHQELGVSCQAKHVQPSQALEESETQE